MQEGAAHLSGAANIDRCLSRTWRTPLMPALIGINSNMPIRRRLVVAHMRRRTSDMVLNGAGRGRDGRSRGVGCRGMGRGAGCVRGVRSAVGAGADLCRRSDCIRRHTYAAVSARAYGKTSRRSSVWRPTKYLCAIVRAISAGHGRGQWRPTRCYAVVGADAAGGGRQAAGWGRVRGGSAPSHGRRGDPPCGCAPSPSSAPAAIAPGRAAPRRRDSMMRHR